MRSHPVVDRLAFAGVKLGLERMRAFLATLGEPHLAVPVVHIGGTNGKGSVAAMVTEALVAAGLRVGTTTSPHLVALNERFALNGHPISDAKLRALLEGVERARQDWVASEGLGPDALTAYELLTAAAFVWFAEEQVDVAVVEVGLGGRLDASNVVSPIVTAITSIGLDHTEQLGPSLEAIASEKAGIIKPGVPVVLGPIAEGPAAVLARAAAMAQAPLWRSGTHLRRERRADGWRIQTPQGEVGPVTLSMPGVHQGGNAAVAVGVLHRLAELGFPVTGEAIVQGLARAKVGARIQRIDDRLVIDGAHNVEGALALAAWLAEQPRRSPRILVFGMSDGRPPRDVLAPLLAHVDEVALVTFGHPKALTTAQLAGAMGEVSVAVSDAGEVRAAWDELDADAEELIVAGSLYLAGDVLAWLAERERR
ncbi:MAG: hypothetical protein RLZZ383_425 [Pseudomonadota bacterium]